MRLSKSTKVMFGLAAVLAIVGGGAWAQNIEVKGSAWLGTAGGSAGIGTITPLAKLHVIGENGVWAENTTDGTSQAGTVPILAQGDGTAIAALNADRRQVFAIAIEGNGHTPGSRGTTVFYDKAGGQWASSLTLNQGNVGIGTSPAYRLDVAGDIHATGPFRSDQGWVSTNYGGGWYMTDGTWIRAYGDKSLWLGAGVLGSDGGLTVGYGGTASPPNGAIIKGSLGVGTATPDPNYKLYVNGSIAAGGSEIFFANNAGFSPGPYPAGTAGVAYIQNSAGSNTLMIKGRTQTAGGTRQVDLYDNAQVNGSLKVNSSLTVLGSIQGNAVGPTIYTCPSVWVSVYNGSSCTQRTTVCGGFGFSPTCAYVDCQTNKTVNCTATGRLLAP